MTSTRITDSSDMPGHAKPATPPTTPSAATLLRQEGMNR